MGGGKKEVQQGNIGVVQEEYSSQLGQFINRCVKFEVGREKLCSPWIDESIRLSDRDVCNTGYVSDFCGGT